eukprot:g81268.t1
MLDGPPGNSGRFCHRLVARRDRTRPLGCFTATSHGRPFLAASLVGACWGLGHGLGAAGMGVLAFSLKGILDIRSFSDSAEILVSLTLCMFSFHKGVASPLHGAPISDRIAQART